ncbi:hypothetical protein J2Z26_000295 [Bacillus luteolus]|nr:hypothetical protein [Cytobacillus luteolus]
MRKDLVQQVRISLGFGQVDVDPRSTSPNKLGIRTG